MGTLKVNGDISATGTISATSFLGNASSATIARFLSSRDTRNDSIEPNQMKANEAVQFDFKAASTIGLTDAPYSGVMSYRPYSNDSDWTGGPAHQLAFNNAGLYWRQSSGNAWLGWNKLIHSGNYTDYTVTKTGSGASGTWGINITGTANLPAGFTIKHTSSTWGAISSNNHTLVTGWATNDDASIDFLCYPNRTELSVKIDGYFFQNEGQYRCLDTSGGNFVDGASLQFTGVSASVSASTPTALSYGRLQSYSTLCINADTDNSGSEYILLTAGKGLSANNNDGLAIGQSTLTWQGASIITSGNIGNQSVNYANSAGYASSANYANSAGSASSASSANWASGASYANSISSTGFGDGNFTYLQTSGDFYGTTGWAHYLIANHGNGATYYNYVIKLPFWSSPKYQYQTGNTSSVSGWHDFITSENYTSYCAPASHSHNYATLGAPNNLMHSGNEFTFAPAGYNGSVWFNYRTAGWDTNGNISQYIFGNGKGGVAPIEHLYDITHNYGAYDPNTQSPYGTGVPGAIFYRI